VSDLERPLASVHYPMGTPEELEALAEEIRALGVRSFAAVADVRDEAAVESLISRTVAEMGRVDVLVNNAGINNLHWAVDLPSEAWEEMLDTNLKGVFLCSRAAANAMKKAGRGGKIVSTGSVLSFTSAPMQAHYTAAKHGVAGLTKALALELAPDQINVNMVCPSAVATTMGECLNDPGAPADYGEQLIAATGSWNLFDAQQPPLHPDDITQAVLWLASDSARFVTGSAVVVDLGFLTK
jgi:NAD(P)-dependent dehydrogenase (short-subunit alcohol dehydrogenase family)